MINNRKLSFILGYTALIHCTSLVAISDFFWIGYTTSCLWNKLPNFSFSLPKFSFGERWATKTSVVKTTSPSGNFKNTMSIQKEVINTGPNNIEEFITTFNKKTAWQWWLTKEDGKKMFEAYNHLSNNMFENAKNELGEIQQNDKNEISEAIEKTKKCATFQVNTQRKKIRNLEEKQKLLSKNINKKQSTLEEMGKIVSNIKSENEKFKLNLDNINTNLDDTALLVNGMKEQHEETKLKNKRLEILCDNLFKLNKDVDTENKELKVLNRVLAKGLLIALEKLEKFIPLEDIGLNKVLPIIKNSNNDVLINSNGSNDEEKLVIIENMENEFRQLQQKNIFKESTPQLYLINKKPTNKNSNYLKPYKHYGYIYDEPIKKVLFIKNVYSQI